MLIDWFTVVAQAFNFLILVWLLKRFLYKPILDAIDTREERIAKELADADAKQTEAQMEFDEFQKKNVEFNQQCTDLLSKATHEAKIEGQRVLDDARKAADALSAKRQEALRIEAQNLNQTIAQRTQDEVFAIAHKVLAELASSSLEEQMSDVFTSRFHRMDESAKIRLGAALKTASEPAILRSAFPLEAEQRTKIQNTINKAYSADIPLQFESAPNLIAGIELIASGQKVAWSIADYLASLEKGVGELLKAKEKPKVKPELESEVKVESKLAEPLVHQ